MPREFDGAPFPFNIVLTTDVEDLPAAFGLVAATALGAASVVTRRRTRKMERWFFFTVNS
jgi:hypothetical protein